MSAATTVELRQVANEMAANLERHGISDCSIEAEVLLRHALRFDRAEFYASLRMPVNPERLAAVWELLERRISGEPLAYITGHREFYGMDFAVSPAVLIPRQETELLVDTALAFARERPDGISVADVGTGCGAIAVAIAAHAPNTRVYAIDCSADALEIAERNCQRHGVQERVFLLEGDLLARLPEPVDLIVSNPPYIASDLFPALPREVLREPRLALDGGGEGLEVIRRLLEEAPPRLKASGRLAFEISPEQLSAVKEIAKEHFPDADVTHTNDMLGLPRCVTISTE